MDRTRQSHPLPFEPVERREEKTATKLVQPFTKLFRERGPARPQDLIRQKLREPLELPPSASFNMPPRPLQTTSPMQAHPYSNQYPNSAPFNANTPFFPSPGQASPRGQSTHHDQNHLTKSPSRIDLVYLQRAQTAEPRSETPVSMKNKGGAGLRWAKKVLSPFSRAKGKQKTASPDNDLHSTVPDAYVRQRFLNDSLSVLEEPVAQLKLEQAAKPYFALRRKPLPRSTSLDSQSPEVLFTSSERLGQAEDAKADPGFKPVDRVASGRGRTATIGKDEEAAHARRPHAMQRRLTNKGASTMSFPDSPHLSTIPLHETMHVPVVPSQGPSQGAAAFGSQPMQRSDDRMQTLYLNRPQQPPGVAVPRVHETAADSQDGASMDWHYAHLSAIGRLDEIVAEASNAQRRPDANHSTRLVSAPDRDTSSSERAPALDRKHVIVPERRSSSELPKASRANAGLRFPVSTTSSAVDAFELEKRLITLDGSGRQQRNVQSARKVSPSQRRGFAEKMLSGGSGPLASERHANDAVADMHNSALGLRFPKQDEIKDPRDASTTDKELDARVGLRVLYRNRTPMPSKLLRGAQLKQANAPFRTPMPQLGHGAWNESTHLSQQHVDSEARGRSETQKAVTHKHEDVAAYAMAEEGQLSNDSIDPRPESLTSSQAELLDRMEVWREKVAHTPKKQVYAPSASASFRADGKTIDPGQEDPDLTSVSRRVQVGESRPVTGEGAPNSNVAGATFKRGPVEPLSNFSASHNRSQVDHSQHISLQGPASELAKFVRGSIGFAANNAREKRQERPIQSRWQQPREEMLIDIDDKEGASSRKATSPPVAFGTRHIRQMSEKDSQHLIDMVGDHLSAVHTPKSSKDDPPLAEHGQLTADETLMWNVLNDDSGEGQAGIDLLLEAYRKELREFLRMNPRMLLLVKLRNKMGKNDHTTGEHSTPSGSAQRVSSSPPPDKRVRGGAEATEAHNDSNRLGKAMETIVANAETIAEPSQVQRSLIELHRDMIACVSDNAQRDALMQRLASLEKAIFVPK